MTHDTTPPKRVVDLISREAALAIIDPGDGDFHAGNYNGIAALPTVTGYTLTSEADAMVAAALREAAELVADDHVSDAILNLADNHAAAALDKLIAEAEAAERDRVTRIAASLFPGGYDNNRIKIEDRLSEIAAKGGQA